MKVALVFPRYKYPSGDIPLGISYLASVLKDICEVKIIDTTFNTSNEFIENSFKEKFDLVGISCMTTMFNDALKIANFVKKKHPETKVIVGGPHATVMPETLLKNKSIDAICVGEGEETLKVLVNKKLDFKNIDGIWYKRNNKIIRNKPRKPIEDLDSLPIPAFNLFPMEKYFENWFQLDSVKRNLRGVNIFASRGCPYQCTYCQPTLYRIFGYKIRKRSPESVIEELKYWKKKYKINAFMFQDDTLMVDREWVIKICEMMIKENLNLIWGCNARANLVEKELFAKMREAGLRKVFMGIESGSQRVLDEIYDKRITLEQVKNAVKILKSLKLKVQGYFMLGAPTETVKEIKKTINFASKLTIDEATFSITTPLPHTYLYDKTKNLIEKDVTEFDYYKMPVYKEIGELTPEKLKKLKKKAFLKFYLSPKRLPQTIKAFSSPAAIKKSFNKLKRL